MHRTHTAAERPTLARFRLFIVALSALTLIAGCGNDRNSKVAAEPLAIRTPLPTFTPTQIFGAAAAATLPETAVSPIPPAAVSEIASVDVLTPPPVPTATFELPGTGGPVGSVDPNQPVPVTPAPAATTPPEPLLDPPIGVINTELVNGRSAPDTNAAVILVLGRSEDYDITGKSSDGSWWRMCCAEGREIWAKAEFVDTDGRVDDLPVAQAGEVSTYAIAMLTATTVPPAPEVASVNPTPTPSAAPEVRVAPVETAVETAADATIAASESTAAGADTEIAAPAAAAAPASEFDLVGQESFPETNVVRVFLYVYGDNLALEGYSLRVTKDGAEQPVSGESWGGQPGMTWPIANERQRFQNYKVEFPGVSPAGVWTAELTRGGAVVGPVATFNLVDNEPNREMYVRYVRK